MERLQSRPLSASIHTVNHHLEQNFRKLANRQKAIGAVMERLNAR